jgi:hypothetical protein
MLHTLRFFLFKMPFIHNATFFGSCIIHILDISVLKFKRKFRRLKFNVVMSRVVLLQFLLIGEGNRHYYY